MSLKAKQKLADEMHRAIDFIYILDKFNKLNFDIYKNNDFVFFLQQKNFFSFKWNNKNIY
ncbi:hypothetical protein [Spiroplasma citri]|uniref:hypothetical protein n=1 Tax=Spiroplasma citri TaxID=2133 RepID=UPI00286F70D9|nr:hypothetical protein [Spiroplasma citri]